MLFCCGPQVMAPNCKIYALKRIRLQGRDTEAASGFLDEITLLKRLRNKPNIIQLIDSQVGVLAVLDPCSALQRTVIGPHLVMVLEILSVYRAPSATLQRTSGEEEGSGSLC